MEYSCSGSSKRPKPPTARNDNIIRCSVDGCNSDLSKCREYHRRHKVCELHSKTPRVTVGGRELRFCQQCSRFQSLVEFDEGKRSCRKRLEGHNRRRRKPHPDSISENSGLILPSQQGSRLLSFNSQPQPIIHGAEETAVNYMHPFLAGFSTQSFKEKVFSGGLNEAENSNNNNNNGARSLLSSATSQPLIYSGLHYGGGNSESDGGGLNQYGSTQQVENKPFVFPAAGGADDDGTHNTTTTGLHFQNPTATGSLTFRWE